MPKPVTVSVEVPQDRESVFDFLDVMANHESFTDHLMRDWELSGPERGVGSKARVHQRALGISDTSDIKVPLDPRPARRSPHRAVHARLHAPGERERLVDRLASA